MSEGTKMIGFVIFGLIASIIVLGSVFVYVGLMCLAGYLLYGKYKDNARESKEEG